MSPRPRFHRRGQGIAEFALVAPVFFLIMGGFMLISLWMLNGLVIEGSARNSALYASNRFANYLAYVAAHPIIFTAADPSSTTDSFFYQLPDPEVADGTLPYDSSISSAFAIRNDQSQTGYVNRLGWDWGILPTSAGQISAAFDDTAKYFAAQASHLFGGIPDGSTAHICLLYTLPPPGTTTDDSWCAANSLSSVLVTLTPGTGGGYGIESEKDADVSLDPAPRYVRIEMDLPLVRWSAIPLAGLVASDGLHYKFSATERLGRVEPACPIPVDDSAALASGCGVAYPPDPSVP